ncbi:MAG: Rab family GTPase [Candidatus Hodarchaeota archaeon]
MERQIIKALIYSNLDDEIGPNPKAYSPQDFSQLNLLHISVKTFAILTGERGMIPESLVILPFPSLQLKALIKYIQWKDPDIRGGIGQSNIALLFQEMDDVIFYKYLKEFSNTFDDIAQNIAFLERSKASKEEFGDELKNLEASITELIEKLKNQELTEYRIEALAEEIDRSLIDYQFKIIVVGDPTVGKTSLILRYTNNAFRRSYVSTLGVHVSNKIFKTEDSTIIQLVLWDVGGQERFKLMRKQFYQGSDAILLVFDLTNPETFSNIPVWFLDIKKQINKLDEDFTGYIIGNKKDLKEDIKITADNAQKLADQMNLKYLETSALSGENVDYAFTTLAKFLYESRK